MMIRHAAKTRPGPRDGGHGSVARAVRAADEWPKNRGESDGHGQLSSRERANYGSNPASLRTDSR